MGNPGLSSGKGWGVIPSKHYPINLITGYEMGRADHANMFVSTVKDPLVDNYFKQLVRAETECVLQFKSPNMYNKIEVEHIENTARCPPKELVRSTIAPHRDEFGNMACVKRMVYKNCIRVSSTVDFIVQGNSEYEEDVEISQKTGTINTYDSELYITQEGDFTLNHLLYNSTCGDKTLETTGLKLGRILRTTTPLIPIDVSYFGGPGYTTTSTIAAHLIV